MAPNALRVAAVWGTTVLALKTLSRGESFSLGDERGAALPIPDGLELPNAPIRANLDGWELDARGAVSGLLTLRGRAEDPVSFANAGAPVPIVPGDFGLVQYGQFSIFFQYTSKPIRLSAFTRPELLLLLAIVCSFVLHGGGVLLTSMLATPMPLGLPPELDEDLASRFRVDRPTRSVTIPPEVAAGPPSVTPPSSTEGAPPSSRSSGASARPSTRGRRQVGVGDLLGDASELDAVLGSIPSVGGVLGDLDGDNVIRDGAPSGPHLYDGRSPGAFRGFRGKVDPRFRSDKEREKDRADLAQPAPRERVIVTKGPAAAAGPLPPQAVKRVIDQRIGSVRACYEAEAQKDRNLRGGLTAHWTIEPSGRVGNVSIVGSSLGNGRVEGCVGRQIASWHFPEAAGSTAVDLPISFGLGAAP